MTRGAFACPGIGLLKLGLSLGFKTVDLDTGDSLPLRRREQHADVLAGAYNVPNRVPIAWGAVSRPCGSLRTALLPCATAEDRTQI
jgi:hypothetical protein